MTLFHRLFDDDQEDRPAVAAALLLSALFILSLQDGLVRLAGADTTLWQFQILRSSGNAILLLILARVIWGTATKRPKRVWAVALRSALLISTMIFFFGGVPEVTLSQMAAGLYTFPVWVTLAALCLPGEKVGPWRLGAVAVGAAGAAVILRPWEADFTPTQIMPVLAGACYAGNVLVTRRLCREESPVTMAMSVAVALIGTGLLGISVLAVFPMGAEAEAALPFLARGWVPLQWEVLGLAALCSVLNLAANVSLTKAYQTAEPSWLAPFDYVYLAFAALWGWVLFATVPDGWTITGSVMIAGAGALTAWRERVSRRRGPQATAKVQP